MYELVERKGNEIFTNSKIIAKGTDNKHSSIQAIIAKYQADIEEFGSLRFEMRVIKREIGATTEKVYFLNEEQATFVITLLRNSKVVVKFKKELVRQFYQMRNFIYEHNSQTFKETRQDNKNNRLKETDVIKLLAAYAKKQGSEHSDMLYMTYTKLAKTVICGKRDDLSIRQLNTLSLVESIILQTIHMGMEMNMSYKDIYKDCKDRIERFKDIAYFGTNSQHNEKAGAICQN